MLFVLLIAGLGARAQYVEKERDDTIRMYCQTRFDTLQARKALARGTGTIKGVAFTKQRGAYGIKPIYANKMKIILFPMTPYLEEYIHLKKKENPKKLKYVYMDPNAWKFRLEAITNSNGEFTFPEMKPGRYYIQGVINWTTNEYYDQYTGYGSNGYNTTNYYERKYYDLNHAEFLEDYVEVKEENEVVKIKLK